MRTGTVASSPLLTFNSGQHQATPSRGWSGEPLRRRGANVQDAEDCGRAGWGEPTSGWAARCRGGCPNSIPTCTTVAAGTASDNDAAGGSAQLHPQHGDGDAGSGPRSPPPPSGTSTPLPPAPRAWPAEPSPLSPSPINMPPTFTTPSPPPLGEPPTPPSPPPRHPPAAPPTAAGSLPPTPLPLPPPAKRRRNAPPPRGGQRAPPPQPGAPTAAAS